MIDDPNPQTWQDLQSGVCRLFNEIGLSARTEVPIATPRGKVTVDVYATDERSVDKIKYLVECKNWNTTVPQAVVHAFTTVMYETGSNIGFIVSKHGLQHGAEKYTRSTNITGLTYAMLQTRYLPIWWQKQFCVGLGAASDALLQYIEPINCRRERYVARLTPAARRQFEALHTKYESFAMAAVMIGHFTGRFSLDPPRTIRTYKTRLVEVLGEEYSFSSKTYRELRNEISAKLDSATAEFHQIFGSNIFEDA